MTVQVPLLDLAAQHRVLASDIAFAIDRVLHSSRFVLGPEVERFEDAAAAFLGAEHAIGVSSGTDAIYLALAALGVGSGDDVLTTPFTFIATAESILRLGARPRFVDIDPSTLNLNALAVAAALSERTRAILPVHLFGTPATLDTLCAITEPRGIPIVEDAAQSFGSRYFGRAAGTWGTAGCFSFFPAKVLGALGDAGLVVTNDAKLASRCRRLRQHGAGSHGEYVEVGGNFRLDAIQAAVLSVKLQHVPTWIARRRANAGAYDDAFSGVAGLAAVARGEGWNGSTYTLRIDDGRRDALRSYLDERGIETAVYYDRPLHLQPVLSHLGLERGSFPESERASAEVLSLPVYPEMSDAQRAHVIESVTSFF